MHLCTQLFPLLLKLLLFFFFFQLQISQKAHLVIPIPELLIAFSNFLPFPLIYENVIKVSQVR